MSNADENMVYMQVPAYISATWDPKPDITAYELAQLVPLFFSRNYLTEAKWAELGPANRHLKRSS